MSRLRHILILLVALNGAALHAQAQEQPPAQSQSPPPSQTPAQPAIDPTKLGISFDRVRMELTHVPPSKRQGLKIQETIEVVGKAPAILLWDPKTANLKSAAVPYGAPTQKDIMKLIVPKEFQNYPFDLNALMQWLSEHLNKKTE
jgi:hypothetical protein